MLFSHVVCECSFIISEQIVFISVLASVNASRPHCFICIVSVHRCSRVCKDYGSTRTYCNAQLQIKLCECTLSIFARNQGREGPANGALANTPRSKAWLPRLMLPLVQQMSSQNQISNSLVCWMSQQWSSCSKPVGSSSPWTKRTSTVGASKRN